MWLQLARLGIVAGGLMYAADVACADPSTTFQVNARIVSGCLVVGGGSDYGNLNYPTQATLTQGSVVTPLVSGVKLQCTPGVALSMTVNAGLNFEGGTGRGMKRNSGNERIPYQLYGDAGLTRPLSVGQSVAVDYSNPNDIALPIYGWVTIPAGLPAGTYSDVAQIQLTW